MSDRLIWDRDGLDWPNREASRFVEAAGLRWHVQELGTGPELLLAHGTGASTHSWAALLPLLARHFRVIAPDLPGHGFTDAPASEPLSLPVMANALTGLVRRLGAAPVLTVGHSAGAAILIRASLDDGPAPRGIVSLNGALLPFRGLAGQIFSPLARLLFTNPFVPRFFAMRAGDKGAVERLIKGTGSEISPQDLGYYERLFRSPGHVAAALGMMANWNLEPLVRDLPRLEAALLLVAAGNDKAITPDDAFKVRDILTSARVEYVQGLGHLAHEEKPDVIAGIIIGFARSLGILAPG